MISHTAIEVWVEEAALRSSEGIIEGWGIDQILWPSYRRPWVLARELECFREVVATVQRLRIRDAVVLRLPLIGGERSLPAPTNVSEEHSRTHPGVMFLVARNCTGSSLLGSSEPFAASSFGLEIPVSAVYEQTTIHSAEWPTEPVARAIQLRWDPPVHGDD